MTLNIVNVSDNGVDASLASSSCRRLKHLQQSQQKHIRKQRKLLQGKRVEAGKLEERRRSGSRACY